ncbi:MAG: hypothetical protein ACOX08_09285 [Methanobacterium sp.]|jgi:hypothetical protein
MAQLIFNGFIFRCGLYGVKGTMDIRAVVGDEQIVDEIRKYY